MISDFAFSDVDLGGGGSVQPRYKITATIGLVVHAAGKLEVRNRLFGVQSEAMWTTRGFLLPEPVPEQKLALLLVQLSRFLLSADGVALGAASSSVHSEIQLIVFLAIMLHKVRRYI